jgi:cytoskeletal protein CcmA (bactofilin family)
MSSPTDTNLYLNAPTGKNVQIRINNAAAFLFDTNQIDCNNNIVTDVQYFQGTSNFIAYPGQETDATAFQIYSGDGSSWVERLRITGNVAIAEIQILNSTITGHLLPTSSDTYDLGHSDAVWDDIWCKTLNVSAASINLGSVSLTDDGTYFRSDTEFKAPSGSDNNSFATVKYVDDGPALDLTTHIADTTTHGATSDIVGKDDTQTLTNKTLTSPTLTNATDTGTLSVSGDVRVGDDIMLEDGGFIYFGSQNDSGIYHDGSHLRMSTSTGDIYLRVAGTEVAFKAVPNGAVELYHNNVGKLLTTAGGIRVTGDTDTDTITVSGDARIQGNVYLENNRGVYMGDTNSGYLYSDGTHLYLRVGGSGNLNLQVNVGESALVAAPNGATTLYHDNNAKLATAATGIDVTGTVINDGLVQGGDITVDTTSTYDIGKSGMTFNNIWCETLNVSGSTINLGTTAITEPAAGAVQIDAQLTLTGLLSMGDSTAIRLGDSADSVFNWDGAKLEIVSITGNMELQQGASNWPAIRIVKDAGVQLFYNNSEKLDVQTDNVTFTADIRPAATSTYDIGKSGDTFNNIWCETLYTSAGSVVISTVTLTDDAGDLSIDSNLKVTGDVSPTDDIYLGDSGVLYLGAAPDASVYNNGSHSYFDTTTGNTYIRTAGTENAIVVTANGAVTLYHNNNSKLATASGGVTVTGVMSGTATAARYSDLAEKYTCYQDFGIGQVILISELEDYDVEISHEVGSNRVLGVVSENPGLLMNSETEGPQVARVGKVPCWVEGPVKKGNRLISSLNGRARRANLDEYEKSFAFANETIENMEVKLIEVIL